MEIIKELQDWFSSHCNGEWEHHMAIDIKSCDNPGWLVKIDLKGTELENKKFETISTNVSQNFIDQSLGKVQLPFVAEEPLSENWMICYVKDNKFSGAGSPSKLGEILTIFLKWVSPTLK